MQSAFKIITIAGAVIEIRFHFLALDRLAVFPMDAIPTEITAWVTHNIIADIHNFTSVNPDLSFSHISFCAVNISCPINWNLPSIHILFKLVDICLF